MTLFLLFSANALAGWTPTTTADGCAFFIGDPVAGVVPMRAVCDWSVPSDSVIRTLQDLEGLETVFSTVAESRLLETSSGGERRVYQRYRKTALFQREVVLSVQTSTIAGGTRFNWRNAADPAGLTGQYTPLEQLDNLWEVTETATGCHVVFEVTFAPGGTVPSFLLDWFQGAGVAQQLAELHAAAGKHAGR